MDNVSIVLQIIFYTFIIITTIVIIHKQKNIIEKFLINFLFLMIGTITAMGGLYAAVNFPKGQYIHLQGPIIFSLFFISVPLILMMYNMHYIWKKVNSLKIAQNKLAKIIYNNRYFLFIISIILIVTLIVCVYGFIYYIINNLPPSLISDLDGNYMDDGRRKGFIECVYFSGVTFFTVGYGDMVPKGVFFSVIVLLEMMTSFLLSIISIPTLLSILLGRYGDKESIK